MPDRVGRPDALRRFPVARLRSRQLSSDTDRPRRVSVVFWPDLEKSERDGHYPSIRASVGLLVAHGSADFDACHCRVHAIIEQELDSRGGLMPASGLIQELVHGHGSNHSLALFYLLAFVRHARAEITLTANHDVTLSSNRRF